MTSLTGQDIQEVGEALGPLVTEIMFVGGCSLILYAGENFRDEFRPTLDIDAILNVSTYTSLFEFEKKLVSCGFKRAGGRGDPICRWKLGGITFNLMPAKDVDGFVVNRWYEEAIAKPQSVMLANGNIINVIDPGYFLATKIEAFLSRGKLEGLSNSEVSVDLAANKDLEDIVLLLDLKATDFKSLQLNLSPKAYDFVRDFFGRMDKLDYMRDFISRCLSFDLNDLRTDRILKMLKSY